MIHDILPSRGLDRCPLAEGCPCWDDDLRHLCVPGDPCPWEMWFVRLYVSSGQEQFVRCLQWLSEAERDHVLLELGILALRRRRLSALVATQGLLREKRHPVSGVVYGMKETVGIGRYAAAIDNQFNPLYQQLILSPEERTQEEGDPFDEPLTLPFHLPARPETPPQTDSFWAQKPVGHPEVWSAPFLPWDHAPGTPNRDHGSNPSAT